MPKKRGPQSVCAYQPSCGLKQDFERLLQRFTATGTVRYQEFANIWKDMKMSMFCAGRQTDRETREFIEECFRVALQFWLPPSAFQVRAGALYLLYGLYHFQLCSPPVKIRVSLQNWKDVIEFQTQARQQEHLDIDYIFNKLRAQRAFHFVYQFSETYWQTKEPSQDETLPETFKEETSVIQELFSAEIMEQLTIVHDQYHKMKVALAGPGADNPDRSLNVVHGDLVHAINRTLSHHKEKILNVHQGAKRAPKSKQKGGSDSEEEWQETQKNTKRGRLKAKAFEKVAKASKSRRHRQAKAESASEKSPTKHERKAKFSSPQRSSEEDLGEGTSSSTVNMESEADVVLSMPQIVANQSPPASPDKGVVKKKKRKKAQTSTVTFSDETEESPTKKQKTMPKISLKKTKQTKKIKEEQQEVTVQDKLNKKLKERKKKRKLEEKQAEMNVEGDKISKKKKMKNEGKGEAGAEVEKKKVKKVKKDRRKKKS